MKKSFFIFSFMLISAAILGQPVMQLASTEHDFGVFAVVSLLIPMGYKRFSMGGSRHFP